MTRNQIANLEGGRRDPHVVGSVVVARALGVAPQDVARAHLRAEVDTMSLRVAVGTKFPDDRRAGPDTDP
jgi:hypothetical protein